MTAQDWLAIGLISSSVSITLLIIEQARSRRRLNKVFEILNISAEINTAITTAVFKNAADIRNLKGNDNA